MSGCASSRPARWQRGGQRYQRRKHATTKSSFRATTPTRAQPGQSPDVSNWKVARFTEAKSCGEPAARRSRRTVLGRFLQCVKKHAFQLVGNVKANDAQIAYPNDCFVLGFQCHHGSLPPAAVMALWPSFSRFGSSQLLRNHPHVAVLILHLWVTHICPIRIAGKEKEGSFPIACATSPMHVSRDHNLRQESIHQDRSPRWIGPRRPKLVSVGQHAFTEVWKSRRDYLESRLLCRNKFVQVSNQRFGTQRGIPGSEHVRPQVLGNLQGIQIRRRTAAKVKDIMSSQTVMDKQPTPYQHTLR